jgi:hypothetical protein
VAEWQADFTSLVRRLHGNAGTGPPRFFIRSRPGTRSNEPLNVTPALVARSAEQVVQGFGRLIAGTDLVAVGVETFGHLAELRARGVALEEFLCFVLYFRGPEAEPDRC